MLGKLQKCNKGTSVPELTSITVYHSPGKTLDAHIYMHLVRTNVKS